MATTWTNGRASYTPGTPGVLDEDDYLWCFKIAGVIWDASSQASIHDGFGVQLSLTDLNILQSDLRSRLVGFDSATVNHIQGCIIQYAPIETATGEMESGAVGSTTGLNYSPAKKREAIKESFSSLTGCLGMWQARMMKKKAMNGERSEDFIGVTRG